MNNYQVLWIDDKWQEQSSVITLAGYLGVEIKAEKFFKKGRDIFKANPIKWDAIILDARGLEKTEDSLPDTPGMHTTIDFIKSKRNEIPILVYTGTDELINNEEFEKSIQGKIFEGKLFNKGSDPNEFIKKIIEAINQTDSNRLRMKYSGIFESCSLDYIGEISADTIAKIVNVVETGDYINSDILNPVRKIIDTIFETCKDIGIIPSSIKDHTSCSKFLCSTSMTAIVPEYIQKTLPYISQISNEGSHIETTDRLIKEGRAPFIINSIIYGLFSVIYWLKDFIDNSQISKQDLKEIVEAANNNFGEIVSIEGYIPHHSDTNVIWYSENCTFSKKDEIPLERGMLVRILSKTKNKNPRTEKYPFFVTNWELV